MSAYPEGLWGSDICRMEGHNYGRDPHQANCISCGELNGPLLAYIGRVAKVEKRTGLSFRDSERLMSLRDFAKVLVTRKSLGDLMAVRSFTENDV